MWTFFFTEDLMLQRHMQAHYHLQQSFAASADQPPLLIYNPSTPPSGLDPAGLHTQNISDIHNYYES